MLLDQYEEPLSSEERAEFVEYLRVQLKTRGSRLVLSILSLVASFAGVVPFMAGHIFHNKWASAKYLIYLCELMLLWMISCATHTYYAWMDLRAIRRDPSDE